MEDERLTILVFLSIAVFIFLGLYGLDTAIEYDNYTDVQHEFYKFGYIHASCELGYHCDNTSMFKTFYDEGYIDGLEHLKKIREV